MAALLYSLCHVDEVIFRSIIPSYFEEYTKLARVNSALYGMLILKDNRVKTQIDEQGPGF